MNDIFTGVPLQQAIANGPGGGREQNGIGKIIFKFWEEGGQNEGTWS